MMNFFRKLCAISLALTFLTIPSSPAQASTTDCTIASNTKCMVTFTYSGAPETWTVPAGIQSIYFDVRGAQGGGTSGGQGGIDTGTLTVNGGTNLIIRVGGQGTLGLTASGGFNGGGSTNSGDTAPGSGGGASDIRLTTDTFTARVVVAGGGGGQSTYCAVISQPLRNAGGDGGGSTGGDGGGGAGCWNNSYGGGGTQSAGGIIGGMSGFSNTAGSLGKGGNGKGQSAGGGGGGGGYYGGGGAAVGAGGGGSSYVHPTLVTNFGMQRGGRTGDGVITITYLNFQNSSITLATSSASVAYRKSMTLTASSAQNGKVTFFANEKKIPGCIGIALSSSATCTWLPSARGVAIVKVILTPSGPYYSSSSSTTVSVVQRTGVR
jgi:hypothetical protein